MPSGYHSRSTVFTLRASTVRSKKLEKAHFLFFLSALPYLARVERGDDRSLNDSTQRLLFVVVVERRKKKKKKMRKTMDPMRIEPTN